MDYSTLLHLAVQLILMTKLKLYDSLC